MCTEDLWAKLQYEADWETVKASSDPLLLLDLIERVLLSKTEDHYPFAVVFEHQRAFLEFQRQTHSLHDYYEKFKTKLNVGDNIGITYLHPALLEYCAQVV